MLTELSGSNVCRVFGLQMFMGEVDLFADGWGLTHLQLCDMMQAVRYIALKLSPFCLISKQLVSNLPQASRISKSLYRWMFRYWRMKKTTWSKEKVYNLYSP